MTQNNRDPSAKIKHIDACLLSESQYKKSNGLDDVNLPNEAGAAIALSEVDLKTVFCGEIFLAPLMIAPMTGGIEKGAELNRIWSVMAEHFRIPMSVGSQRIALEKGDRAGFFQIRQYAKSAFVFGNLGAANLKKETALETAQRAVDMVDANALFIHFNAMQEACQSGDTDFKEALCSLEIICSGLQKNNVKVFAREVGFGLSKDSAKRFINAGVDGVDCSGAGGTSWSKVESLCAHDESSRSLGNVFAEWGIPTAASIRNVREVSRKVPLIASGGIRTGLDIAKTLFLGADMSSMARPMLLAATQGEEHLARFIEKTLQELRVSMFACGVRDISALKNMANPIFQDTQA